MRSFSIVIVGAGATGALLAIQLARRFGRAVSIALVDRSGSFGLGAAYHAANPDHTLNVPAYLMAGIDAHDGEGFVRYLHARDAAASLERLRVDYPARGLFGAYVTEWLDRAAPLAARFERIADEAVRMTPHADGVNVHLASGGVLAGDFVALCLGNLAPPPLAAAHARIVEDPWRPGALADVRRDERVLMVGSALTMVDTVLELERLGAGSELIAVSRHGGMPLEDRQWPAHRDFFDPRAGRRGLVHVSRLLRAEVRAAAAQGVPWQAVVDAFRAHAVALWEALGDADRRRFLRHARTVWLAHRHRLPSRHMRRLEALQAGGRLRTVAARVLHVDAGEGGVSVTLRRRGSDHVERVTADRVVNCTGPQSDYARATMPLIRAMLHDALARPDPYRLGLDVDGALHIIDARGQAQPRIVAIGPPTRGRFWEVVAVPHLRRQIEQFVDALAKAHAK